MSRISDVVDKIMQISGEMNIFYLVSFDKGFKGKKCFIFKCGVFNSISRRQMERLSPSKQRAWFPVTILKTKELN